MTITKNHFLRNEVEILAQKPINGKHATRRVPTKKPKGKFKKISKFNSKESPITPKVSDKNQNVKLHTIYKDTDNHSSDFTLANFIQEKALLKDAMLEYGSEKFWWRNLPHDHLLVRIIEAKRVKFLTDWENKKIPIGSSFKSDQKIADDWTKLCILDAQTLLRTDDQGNRNNLCDFSHLVSGVNQNFPEMMAVETSTKPVIERLRNSEQFLTIYIEKLLMNKMKNLMEDGRNFCYAFHKCFRTGNWTQTISNFQPMIVKYLIMESFHIALKSNDGLPNDKFVVLDNSTGWGGRLVGVLSSCSEMRRLYKNKYGRELTVAYITTDPNTKVHSRFNGIIEDWFNHIEPKQSRNYFKFYKEIVGSETPEFFYFSKSCFEELGVEGANVAITSPPYFDREKYSDDAAQSYIKYRKYQDWKNGFLHGMIKNANALLLPNGLFYLNIADIRVNKGEVIPIATDTKEFAKMSGFELKETYKIVMTKISKLNSDDANSVMIKGKLKKYEPVFVFQKQDAVEQVSEVHETLGTLTNITKELCNGLVNQDILLQAEQLLLCPDKAQKILLEKFHMSGSVEVLAGCREDIERAPALLLGFVKGNVLQSEHLQPSKNSSIDKLIIDLESKPLPYDHQVTFLAFQPLDSS